MKTRYKSIALFFIMIGLMISCTDTIDVDVPNAGERLVVEASINWEKGTSGQTQTIKLSKSTAYFSNVTFNPVLGATVTVTKNNDDLQFTFQDQGDGNYVTTNFVPELNESYSLEIQYNGQTYRATETLVSVSNINRVEQDVEGGGGVGDDEILVKAFFDDPINQDNYYLGEFIPSHRPVRGLQALDDKDSDGNENFIEYEDEDLDAGDEVVINLYGVSRRSYEYLNLLIQNSFGFDGPFQTTPAQLKGNCININNPDEEVLGYFRLSEFVTTSYVIE